jgi:hypothetical protein
MLLKETHKGLHVARACTRAQQCQTNRLILMYPNSLLKEAHKGLLLQEPLRLLHTSDAGRIDFRQRACLA